MSALGTRLPRNRFSCALSLRCHFPIRENFTPGDTLCVLLQLYGWRKVEGYQYLLGKMVFLQSLRPILLGLPAQSLSERPGKAPPLHGQPLQSSVSTLSYPKLQRVFWVYKYTYA